MDSILTKLEEIQKKLEKAEQDLAIALEKQEDAERSVYNAQIRLEIYEKAADLLKKIRALIYPC